MPILGERKFFMDIFTLLLINFLLNLIVGCIFASRVDDVMKLKNANININALTIGLTAIFSVFGIIAIAIFCIAIPTNSTPIQKPEEEMQVKVENK